MDHAWAKAERGKNRRSSPLPLDNKNKISPFREPFSPHWGLSLLHVGGLSLFMGALFSMCWPFFLFMGFSPIGGLVFVYRIFFGLTPPTLTKITASAIDHLCQNVAVSLISLIAALQ